MKKLFIVLPLLIIGCFVRAQDKPKYLEVDYQMEMKFDLEKVMENVPAQYRAMVRDQIKQEMDKGIFVDYKLKTNGEMSEYKMQEKISNSQSGGGMIMSQITAYDKEPLYKDQKEGVFYKLYDIGKQYIVKDSLIKFDWKISREKEQIAGFDALKATGVMNDSIPVTAWYSPKLNFKDGPDRLWGLPGLILKAEFNINNSDLIITAVNVAVKEDEFKVTKPTKGKFLTEKEFMDEMKKMQEKYKEMYGDGVDSDN